MTDIQLIALLGFFLPLFVAVVKKEKFANWVNAVIALAVYAIAAGVVTALQVAAGTPFTAQMYVGDFMLVFGSGTIGYFALWQNSVDPAIQKAILP